MLQIVKTDGIWPIKAQTQTFQYRFLEVLNFSTIAIILEKKGN